MLTRRRVVDLTGRGALLAFGSKAFLQSTVEIEAKAAEKQLNLSPLLPDGTRSEAVLDTLPGKRPLIKLSFRPPNYESPVEYLRTPITPNEEFFVRYHLSDIPEVDAATWFLNISGDAANGEVRVSLDDLRQMPNTEVVAVCQCSGNRRGLFVPHVPGVEWGYGAMGCARWKGVPLKDVLQRAGLKADAVEIVLAGTDRGASDNTPPFVKSLPVWKALEDSTIIAYEMNGKPLPHWNGFPARVIVPGWTATYWMKHVTTIRAVAKPFDGFWMKSAYRIPVGTFPVVARFASQETAVNTPITEMVINSLITSHADGATVKAGSKVMVSGIAWDAGYGISSVDLSSDGGASWTSATLGEDFGRFAARSFSYTFPVPARGAFKIIARANNKIGQTQVSALIPNPAGYHHNVMHSVTLNAA